MLDIVSSKYFIRSYLGSDLILWNTSYFMDKKSDKLSKIMSICYPSVTRQTKTLYNSMTYSGKVL